LQQPAALSRAETRHALAVVTRLVRRRGSVLTEAARSLSTERRRLFYATYASMRLIDDYIDNEFLALAPVERAALRGTAMARLECWQRCAWAAAEDRLEVAPGEADRDIFVALTHVVGRSELGPGPWCKLATALARDIEEWPIHSWQDFLDYSEGAAVAPAEVFVYTLGCRFRPEGGSEIALPRAPADYARNLALFCYLVHILRDLALDLSRAPQLVSVPRELMAAQGLNLESLAAAVGQGQGERVWPLVEAVADFAAPYRERAQADISAFETASEPAAAELLWQIHGIYSAVFDELRRDPSWVLAQSG
jgi:phytoene synthase